MAKRVAFGLAKEEAVAKIIVNHILSERQRLGLLPPEPNAGLAAAARETAMWFAAESDSRDETLDYLQQRCAEQPGGDCTSWILRLAYGRHVWPVDVEPSEIAKDLIDRVGLSEIVGFRDLDYLAIGSCHAVLDRSGNPVEASTNNQGHEFGYALVVAYAADGNGMIVDRLNERRQKVGVSPLRIFVPLRELTRKFITSFTADEANAALSYEAQNHGYLTEGWRVRLHYGGSYARFTPGTEISVSNHGQHRNFVAETEMVNIIAMQLLKDWPVLLRPDWQDIGIATSVKNHPELGGLNFHAEFVIGWRIPLDADRPSHFPPPIDQDGNQSTSVDLHTRGGSEQEVDSMLGPVYQEPQPKPQRRRGWWPFRS